MASDVMSLFGMDPRVIQQNRVQSGIDQASRMSADFAVGAAGGQLAGAGINSAFGLQTPDMAQASSVQSGLAGQNLNTASGLRAAAQQLMMNGDYAQAMALHAQARDMESTDTTASNLVQDRSLGKSSNVVVKQGTAADLATMTNATPAKQHSITEHFDGRVMDVTQGKTFATKAEWLDSISKLYGPAAAAAIVDDTKGDSNVEGLSPTEGGGAAEQAANEFDANLALEMSSINPDNTDYSSVDKKAELVRLEDDMKDIYTYLFSRSKTPDKADRAAKATDLLKIKERLRELGYTENKIESLSAGYMPELVGP